MQVRLAKLPAFFQKFQIEVWAQRFNKTKVDSENAFSGDHVKTERNESSNNEKPCFRYFFRFVTHALSLRPQNIYIYVFQAFFNFMQLLSSFLFFLEARSKEKVIPFDTKF